MSEEQRQGARPRLVDGAAGETAHGVAVPLQAVAARRAALMRRAEAPGELRLSLVGPRALLWSVSPVDLPWFDAPLFYLGPPRDRVFAPIGMRLETPRLLLPTLLAALERESGAPPPYLATPDGDETDRQMFVALGEGAPLGAVDWDALSELAKRPAAGAT